MIPGVGQVDGEQNVTLISYCKAEVLKLVGRGAPAREVLSLAP